MDLRRRIASEGIGTAGLLLAVVGSGIAVSRSADGDAIALLIHALVVGGALIALILGLARWSAHFNPVVTLALWRAGAVQGRDVPSLIGAQMGGAFIGVFLANVMFSEAWIAAGDTARTGFGLWVGEAVATFGLVLLIRGCAHRSPEVVAYAVGLFIAGAIWFTSSESFANPAVTLARAATDTWCGIRPVDVPAFVVAQLVGAALATTLASWLDAGVPTDETTPR
ncbi:MAG: aquaporin [Planctomycetes bacterium]|jgi:glycerol uptake facilitator-like aquaporin|nr:aquaporin [Planctomycetota bacterium]